MAVVVIVALAFGAGRALLEWWIFPIPFLELVVLGALPMATVLGIGLIPFLRRKRGRSFMLGFEIFGWAALIAFLISAAVATDTIHRGTGSALQPLGLGSPLFLTVAAGILLLPQLALALLGGWLAGKFRVRFNVMLGVERRHTDFMA
jgi:hypothetical protein